MKKKKETLGSSIPHVIGVVITKLERYNEHVVCRELLIKCGDGHMNHRIELSGFNKNIPVKVKDK